jgi:hypothetical protein
MRRRNFLASAVILFSLAIILVVIAIITYNFVWCNDGFLDSSHPFCVYRDSGGNVVARHTIDQERPYLSIIKEILGAVLFFAVGILSLVCTFKKDPPSEPPPPPEDEAGPTPNPPNDLLTGGPGPYPPLPPDYP